MLAKNNHSSDRAGKVMSVPKTILAILSDVGQVTVKAFFPHPYYHAFCSHRNRQNFHVSLYQLQKRKLITKNSNQTFRLTPIGQKQAFWANLDAKLALSQNGQKKWDGKWRMVLFDIPEKKRRLRDGLRNILRTLDFVELQKSVWVTPHKIPDIINELLWEEKIKHHTRFITIAEIDFDKDLRKKYSLT